MTHRDMVIKKNCRLYLVSWLLPEGIATVMRNKISLEKVGSL